MTIQQATADLNTVELNTPAEALAMREDALIASFLQEEQDMDHCESEHYYASRASQFGLIGLED